MHRSGTHSAAECRRAGSDPQVFMQKYLKLISGFALHPGGWWCLLLPRAL
jgi:hypothetical protein